MDCRVVVEAAVPVYDVETADEAVRIAISKTGGMLNPDLNYVEIDMGTRDCPDCGASQDPAFIAADEGLVALELEMTVFNVERDEHAARIARKEIGQRLESIPLEVLEIETIEDEDEDGTGAGTDSPSGAESDADTDADAGADTDADAGADTGSNTNTDTGSNTDADTGADTGADADTADRTTDEDGDVLPEFEELLDE